MLGCTGCDVLRAKDHLLCHSAPHADVHLSQQLGARLTPAVVLREHGHLRRREKGSKRSKLGGEEWVFRFLCPHMSQTGASGHDGGLVDGHGVFGVVGHDGVARLVVRRDALVLLVYFCTPPLRTFRQKRRAADWPNVPNVKGLL